MRGWRDYAMASELRAVASLEIQMDVVREKLKPHRKRLKELGKQRRWLLNRVYNRGYYQKRKGRG